MSAEILRRAAALMREVGANPFCDCEGTDHWFDRSICPEPCDSMHDICVECGRIKGGCLVAAEARKPSMFMLAVADWLEHQSDEFDRYTARQMDPQRRFHSLWLAKAADEHADALAVARAYLGEAS